jgi:hypothetical protein
VRVETEIVAMIVAVMMALVVVASEMIGGESVGIVVCVRKETDREEGTVVRVHRDRVTDQCVHREIVRRVHKVIAHREIVLRGTVVRVRKETDHKESVDHVHREHRATGQRAHRATASHVQSKRPRHRLRWILPLQPRHHHHQQHQPMILVPLRASKGRKPCYWHRHVQNIAASIAVA